MIKKIQTFLNGHRPLILGFVLFLVGVLPQNPQRYIHSVSVGLALGLLILLLEVWRVFGWLIALAAGWILGSGLIYFRYPEFFFGIFGQIAQAAFNGLVIEAVLWTVLCLIGGILIIRNNYIRLFERSLKYIFWGEIAWMIVGRLSNDPKIGHRYLGMLDNEAMDATFLLTLYPVVMLRRPRPLYQHLAAAAMIFLSDSSTAIVGYGIMWAIWFLMKPWTTVYKKVGLSIAALSIVVASALFYMGPKKLFDPSGRYYVWEKSMDYWSQNKELQLKGSGVGTYALYGPGIQLQGTHPGEVKMVFIWMHNEFLQILFELGIIGFVLTMLVYGRMIVLSYRMDWLLLSLLMYAAISTTQMPFRHPMTTILGVYLICRVFGDNRKEA